MTTRTSLYPGSAYYVSTIVCCEEHDATLRSRMATCLVDDNFTRISGSYVLHRELITRRRRGGRLLVENRRPLCRKRLSLYKYPFRLDTFGICFTFSNKYGISFNEISVKRLRSGEHNVPLKDVEGKQILYFADLCGPNDGVIHLQDNTSPHDWLALLKLNFIPVCSSQSCHDDSRPPENQLHICMSVYSSEARIWSSNVSS